jgi:DNA-binding transcriptional ArsR family regulator
VTPLPTPRISSRLPPATSAETNEPGRHYRADADLLVHIAVGGLRSSELAEHLGLARSTVSEAVTRLRALGLVVSRDCATDRRAKPLGFRRPPLLRFMASFVFGYTRSMHKFLAQLAAAATVRPVADALSDALEFATPGLLAGANL